MLHNLANEFHYRDLAAEVLEVRRAARPFQTGVQLSVPTSWPSFQAWRAFVSSIARTAAAQVLVGVDEGRALLTAAAKPENGDEAGIRTPVRVATSAAGDRRRGVPSGVPQEPHPFDARDARDGGRPQGAARTFAGSRLRRSPLRRCVGRETRRCFTAAPAAAAWRC